ncbi:Sulfate/thiosulfate import ATP-binding protein CysA [Vibrio aerogenes CECT 7868]|uniref:Sulfate/thiosulfate import ATP-binding protein CysA n=1 Tax=Vibrio aerogenes CECT 7868 TaxID=1216006 RepID=A0A1M5ZKP7_9VIBR|nr:molybdenum ABC transporter ATP-binding protein [Vibrio aerogenes]SHI24925.1 Sulfate/thiosulfate import ATP-binding protein CysA [Vibrio aerogenes CECT 7868]
MNDIHAQFSIDYPGFSLALDLKLPASGITVLFGPSGSGKTTCLRAIAGLQTLKSGYLSVAGEIWQSAEPPVFVPTHQRDIGYVFQEAGLFPHMSVKKNLEYGYRRIAPEKRKISVQDICQLVGIEHLLERSVHLLSGGEKQRIAIARALLTCPTLLLMDEPLSALDVRLKAEILPYLEKIHTELSIPVIYVTHSVKELARLADHVVLFNQGRVVASGNAQEIMSDPKYAEMFGDEVGSIFDTSVVGHHPHHLTELDMDGVTIWVPGHAGSDSQTYRCRILASDVSITLHEPSHTTMLNRLPVVIDVIDKHQANEGQVMVVLLLENGARLLARITLKSCIDLNLHPGMHVWAQIKSVALS